MTHAGLSRRHFLSRAGLVAGASIVTPLFLAGCNDPSKSAAAGASSTAGSSAGGTTNVSTQISWLVDNGQLGEAVAIGKGWFADNGLNLNIKPGGPSTDGISLVAGGQSQIGKHSSSPSVMLARSQSIPVKCFAVGVQEHPFAYFSKPDKAVHEPKDLIGKTVGTQATGQILLSALLAANDIDPKDVNVVVVGSDVTPLITGQVDVWTGWVSNIAALRPLGKDYVAMRLWDAGIRLYAYPYYTTDQVISSNSDMLVKYLEAAGKGWEFANENVEEAVDYLVKLVPTLNKDDMVAQSKALLPFAFGDTTKKAGWGAMDKDVWQDQIDMWNKLEQFKGAAPTVDDVATFDILDATADSRPKVG